MVALRAFGAWPPVGSSSLPNKAAMASRRTAASRSISSSTACPRAASSGADFVAVMCASMALRISSLMVLSRSWAMTLNWACSSGSRRMANVLTLALPEGGP